jgi:hypothetical protein
MASSDTNSTSSWVTVGKKIPRPEIAFLCQVLILYTGYHSQHLQLDGRIGEQYFVDGTVEELFGMLVP